MLGAVYSAKSSLRHEKSPGSPHKGALPGLFLFIQTHPEVQTEL